MASTLLSRGKRDTISGQAGWRAHLSPETVHLIHVLEECHSVAFELADGGGMIVVKHPYDPKTNMSGSS